MRHYEVMVILDPSIDERVVPATLERFLDVVKTSGGAVNSTDVMGRRRLAFDIKKQSEGVYVVLDLQAEPAAVKEMDRQLNLSESVLRTKVLRPEERIAKEPRPAKEPAETH